MRQAHVVNYIKRITVIILSLVIALGSLPLSLIVKAATEDAVGKSGYKFYYKALEYSDLSQLDDETIFTAKSGTVGNEYNYVCKATTVSVNQNKLEISKYQSMNGVEISYGTITATYFDGGSANLIQEDFSLEEAVITAVWNYDVFKKAFRADSSSINNVLAFDKTDVIDDLESAGVDLLQYPADLTGTVKTPEIINFVEFGYSSNPYMQDYFALYVYFYNPQKIAIDGENLSNRIQIASEYESYPITKNTAPTGYDTYELMLCSKSSGNYAGLFYKFKVLDHRSYDGKTIQERVNSIERRYDVSGIVLADTSGVEKEYTIGGTYRFTGYAKGFGEEGEESTLKNTEYMALETIRLDVTLTSYVQDQENELGTGHYNSISSAYFSIPNKYLTDKNGNITGNLQKVRAEWWEYKTQPIFVITDLQAYNNLKPYLGVNIGDYNAGIENKWYSDYNDDAIMYWDAYNVPKHNLISYLPYHNDQIKTLYYAFYSTNNKVAGSEIESYIKGYNKTADKGYVPIKNGQISADLFLDTVDGERIRGYNIKEINANDKYNLLVDKANGWQKFWGVQNLQDFAVEQAIYALQSSDLTKEDESFANSLYVGEQDAGDIKTKALNAKAVNETPYLLRFATTDYYCKGLYRLHNSDVVSVIDDWKAQETVFLDFKFIDLTFEVDGAYKTIPVVQDPVDHFPDIVNKNYKEPKPNILAWIVLGVAIVVGIVILVGEIKALSYCFSKSKVFGFILLVLFIVLDYFYVKGVMSIIALLGGLWV